MTVRVAVTGSTGFLGWHVFCHALTRPDVTVHRVGRDSLLSADLLAKELDGCAAVIHLAGVNRGSDDDVASMNVRLAESLAGALSEAPSVKAVVFSNSTQVDGDSVYGRAKRRAAELLERAGDAAGVGFADVVLPNLFGEHGRPFYNSFVATFCHQLSVGEPLTVNGDGRVRLLHAQDAARTLVDAAVTGARGVIRPEGRDTGVLEVAELLTAQADSYADGVVPPLTNAFETQLFNQLRSYARPVNPWSTAPTRFDLGRPLKKNSDARGDLVETVKVRGGESHVFVSTSRPGVTRGEHFHTRKVERFVVLSGEAVIALRRLGETDVIEIPVSGDTPVVVDQPTLWSHNLTNVGSTELLAMFWTNEIFDPADADTYSEPVTP